MNPALPAQQMGSNDNGKDKMANEDISTEFFRHTYTA
jgi:hypothetical protein